MMSAEAIKPSTAAAARTSWGGETRVGLTVASTRMISVINSANDVKNRRLVVRPLRANIAPHMISPENTKPTNTSMN